MKILLFIITDFEVCKKSVVSIFILFLEFPFLEVTILIIASYSTSSMTIRDTYREWALHVKSIHLILWILNIELKAFIDYTGKMGFLFKITITYTK